MRIFTAIGCILLLASFVIAHPDVSHLAGKTAKKGSETQKHTFMFKPKSSIPKGVGVKTERLRKPIVVAEVGENVEDVKNEDDNVPQPAYDVPGRPGSDYPIFWESPETSFDCSKRHDGYYADVEARCQVFHVCANKAKLRLTDYIFLCPNGTVFSQQSFVCDWYTNVNCRDSEQYFYINDEYNKVITSEEDMLYEVQRMFNYTLMNLIEQQHMINALKSSQSMNDHVKPTSDGNHSERTTEPEVFISNLGEISTKAEIEKMEKKVKKQPSSFADLWGADLEELDAILNNRLKKSYEPSFPSTLAPHNVSPVTKRDVSHVSIPDRLLGAPQEVSLAEHQHKYLPPPGQKQVYIHEEQQTTHPTVHVTQRPVSTTSTTQTFGTQTQSVVTSRPKVLLNAEDKVESQIDFRARFQTENTPSSTVSTTTERTSTTTPSTTYLPQLTSTISLPTPITTARPTILLRGDQAPDVDEEEDEISVSFGQKPYSPATTTEEYHEQSFDSDNENNSINTLFVLSTTIKNEPSALDEVNRTSVSSISTTEPSAYVSLDEVEQSTRFDNREVITTSAPGMMNRPILLLMPPYVKNKSHEQEQIVQSVVTQTKTNKMVHTGNEKKLMVVFGANSGQVDHNEVVFLKNDDHEADSSTEAKSTTIQPVVLPTPRISTDEEVQIKTVLKEIVRPNVRVTTEIIDLENDDIESISFQPPSIQFRPPIQTQEIVTSNRIGESTVRPVSKTQTVITETQDRPRDDKLQLIQKMIKIIEERMRNEDEHGIISSTAIPLVDSSSHTDHGQTQGVGANILQAMMRIVENASNQSLAPIFSSIHRIKSGHGQITDEDILKDEELLANTINLLRGSDDEISSIIDLNGGGGRDHQTILQTSTVQTSPPIIQASTPSSFSQNHLNSKSNSEVIISESIRMAQAQNKQPHAEPLRQTNRNQVVTTEHKTVTSERVSPTVITPRPVTTPVTVTENRIEGRFSGFINNNAGKDVSRVESSSTRAPITGYQYETPKNQQRLSTTVFSSTKQPSPSTITRTSPSSPSTTTHSRPTTIRPSTTPESSFIIRLSDSNTIEDLPSLLQQIRPQNSIILQSQQGIVSQTQAPQTESVRYVETTRAPQVTSTTRYVEQTQPTRVQLPVQQKVVTQTIEQRRPQQQQQQIFTQTVEQPQQQEIITQIVQQRPRIQSSTSGSASDSQYNTAALNTNFVNQQPQLSISSGGSSSTFTSSERPILQTSSGGSSSTVQQQRRPNAEDYNLGFSSSGSGRVEVQVIPSYNSGFYLNDDLERDNFLQALQHGYILGETSGGFASSVQSIQQPQQQFQQVQQQYPSQQQQQQQFQVVNSIQHQLLPNVQQHQQFQQPQQQYQIDPWYNVQSQIQSTSQTSGSPHRVYGLPTQYHPDHPQNHLRRNYNVAQQVQPQPRARQQNFETKDFVVRPPQPLRFQGYDSQDQSEPTTGFISQRRNFDVSPRFENSKADRRLDNANQIVYDEDTPSFRGFTSYNAPISSVGKLPCDSDSLSGRQTLPKGCFL